MSEDYFDKLFLIDSIDSALFGFKAAEKSSGKNACMSTEDFLNKLESAWKDRNDDATISVKFDELNDMIEVAIVDSDFNESFLLAVPRDPSTNEEELILDILNSGEMESLFPDVIRQIGASKKDKKSQDDEEEADDEDISDEDIEDIAEKIDALTIKASNLKEAYALELAASKIRELKRI